MREAVGNLYRMALTAAELRDLLGQISNEALLASVAQETTIRLWLPRDGKLQQSELSALRFSPAEAVDLLMSLPADPLPAECGDSVRYFVTLARYPHLPARVGNAGDNPVVLLHMAK